MSTGDLFNKALDIILRDEVSNIDMAEGLRRGVMDVVFAENGTVLLRSKERFLYMFLTDDESDGRRALEAAPGVRLCVAHGELSRDVLKQATGLDYETPCRQFAYMSKQKPQLDPKFTYRVLGPEDADYVKAHYKHGFEHIDRTIAAGKLFGAEYEGRLAGFIGMHGEGSVGMLEVDPEFRRMGVGTALENFMFARHIDEGRTAYGQVYVDNDGSQALQKSIGIEAGKSLIWWMFRRDEEGADSKNHIYISPSLDGHMNLAVDEYLLGQYRAGRLGGVTLYFYVNSNAVIIGRNQNAWAECNIDKMQEDGVRLVRRHTGGGAVYHDEGNLNFSFICNEKLYDKERLTSVIVRALESLGINARVSGRNDLTVDGKKFSGCAYGLEGEARSMHGTLLINTDFGRLSEYLNPSKKKLEAKGITSVRSRVMNLSEAADISVDRARDAIIKEFTAQFGKAEEMTFDEAAKQAIGRLYDKHASWEWRLGRTPEFDHSIEERFSFGMLRVDLKVRKGVIERVDAYTDALDTGIPSELSDLLTGVRFDELDMALSLIKGSEHALELCAYILREADPDRLRMLLHSVPELALNEQKTMSFIKFFISLNTSLELHDEGAFICAVHREGDAPAIAVRADFDAVPTACGAAHLCGHDGHTAALLDLARKLEGRTVGKTVILLFQPAEETGEGAPLCLPLFEKESVAAVIGAHNIPGEPMGEILLRRGTFACASCGMQIKMHGRTTHAAYPENGINPTEAIAKLALLIPEKANSIAAEHSCMTMATVVGMRTGERAFGVAASEGEIWLTLRSESTRALDELCAFAKEKANDLASSQGLETETEFFDVFPATVNDNELLGRVEQACKEGSLPYKYVDVPFRWSEDFGHYAKEASSCFMGVGAGEGTPPLHTEGYEYPSGLARRTSEIFLRLILGMQK